MAAATYLPAIANAQQERVALFKTATDDTDLSALASALDPVLSSELTGLGSVEIVARPALDLPSMQLAIDCVGESAECLRAAALEVKSDGLLAPMVRRAGSQVVVSLLRYRAGQEIGMQGVSRYYSGEDPTEQALAGVPDMLHELFGPPAKVEPQPAPTAQPEPALLPAAAAAAATAPDAPAPDAATIAAQTEPADSVKHPLPVWPIVLGATGLALIGTGVAFGLAAEANEDEYLELRIRSETHAEDVDKAVETIDRAETQALLANIGFGVGAAAIVAGGVLLYWQLRERSEPRALLVLPQLGPSEAGVALRAGWVGL